MGEGGARRQKGPGSSGQAGLPSLLKGGQVPAGIRPPAAQLCWAWLPRCLQDVGYLVWLQVPSWRVPRAWAPGCSMPDLISFSSPSVSPPCPHTIPGLYTPLQHL